MNSVRHMNRSTPTFQMLRHSKKELTRSQKLMEIYLGESETNYSNKKISKMLTALKSALIDPELSSLDLSELIDGKFHRRYPKS